MRRHVGSARSAAAVLAALAAGFSPAALAAQAACAAARDDARVTAIAEFLDRIAATAPVWDDFAPANEPVVLAIDTAAFRGAPATPACTLVWRARRGLQLVELTRLPPLSTPLYGFADLTRPGPRADPTADGSIRRSRLLPAEDQERLRAAGVARAAVLPVPLDLSRLGQFGEMLKRANVDPGLIQAELAVHEGFHLHVQFPAWLDQERRYAWPAWDVQPDRNAMRTACYAGSPEISAAFGREVDALLAAYDALFGAGPPDPAAARAAARQFIGLRGARYRLLDTVTVPQGDRRIGCPLAETHLELEEGTAQWIGHATLVEAGIRRKDGLRGSYGAPQPDAFYRTGPLQLWILDGLFGRDALHRLTSALARAPGPEAGLFAEFTARLR